MAVGAVLPVLPHYVKGPLNYGSLAVGFAIGAFAFTALASRPIAGHIADYARPPARRSRSGRRSRPWRARLYFVPAGLPGLIWSPGSCSARARARCSPLGRRGSSISRRSTGGPG